MSSGDMECNSLLLRCPASKPIVEINDSNNLIPGKQRHGQNYLDIQMLVLINRHL